MSSRPEERLPSDTPLLAVLVVGAWAACAAVMLAGPLLLSRGGALVLHAVLAPVFFGGAAWLYFRRASARRSPLAFAALAVALVLALDLAIVAPFVERSFRMFASFAGTWLPLAALFLASWAVGVVVRIRVRDALPPGPERRAIDAFLSRRRVAFVGLSTKPDSFSRYVDAALRAEGYEVLPVHPTADAIGGRPAYPAVQAIPDPPDAALIMTPAARSADVIRDCVAAGVRHVWLHRAAGPGAVSDEALALCDAHGLVAVRGQCPMMFLESAGAGHRAHGYVRKLAGTYPR